MWNVYIVVCADNTLYTGIAKNIEARIAQHNSGKGAKYTRARLPVTMVYHEDCNTQSDALKREYAIKQLSRSKKLQLIQSYEN